MPSPSYPMATDKVVGQRGLVADLNQAYANINDLDERATDLQTQVDGIDVGEGFSVKAYGAVGDGVANDTDEIHAARDAAGPGVELFFPDGTYLVDGLTHDVSRQRWRLAPGATIKLKNNASSDAVQITGYGGELVGGRIDGNRDNQVSDLEGIRTWGVFNTVTGVEVTECHSHGITSEDPGTHANIYNNYVHDNGVQANAIGGIYVNGAPYARISGNVCHDNGDYGTGDSTYDGDGIKVQGAVGDAEKATVTGNYCFHNARRGIKSQQTQAIITNNQCWDNGGAGIGVVGGGPEGSTGVIANNILPANFFGLQLDGAADWTLSGNKVTDSRDHGMSVSTDTTRLTFIGNQFLRAARHGAVCVSLKDSTFIGNTFMDNGQDGVNTFGLQFNDGAENCENILVIGNRSENSAGESTQTHGFVLSGTTDRVHLVGNVAVEGLTVEYSIGGSVTNVTKYGNLPAEPDEAPLSDVEDSFDRANSTTVLGDTDTGETWVQDTGTWGISSNQAYVSTGLNSAYNDATLASEAADVMLEVTLATVIAGSTGLCLRRVDADNVFHVLTDGIWRKVGGSESKIADLSFTDGDRMRVIAIGSSIEVWKQAGAVGAWTLEDSVTDANHFESENHGLTTYSNSVFHRFNDFSMVRGAAAIDTVRRLEDALPDLLTSSITNGDTTHAPTGDAVYDALAGKQAADGDLDAVAAINSTTQNVIASDGSGWIGKTYAQLKTALGLVKGDVGLGNVDNTSDANKPVSTAQQTALDLKANLASPTFTGDPKAPTPSVGDNDTSVATTAYVVAEIASRIAAMNAVVYQGVIDCSANPNYPAADAGALYVVSVAGKIGGASGTNVEAGDLLLCKVDGTSSGTQAGVGANWDVVQTNIDGAVRGPTSATDNRIALFDGASGKLIKDGGVLLSDKQNADQDLTDIAALSPTNDDVMQRKAGAWVNRTLAQLWTDLKDLTVTLTNKTISLGSNTITGTTAQFNTALSDGDFATLAGTETLTNKRITKRVVTTADTATLTIDSDSYDGATVTALAQAMTIAAPTGTPTSMQGLIIRILDNGTARALTWNAAFRAIGVTLPTTTVLSKTTYVGCVWNTNDSKWDVIAVAQQA